MVGSLKKILKHNIIDILFVVIATVVFSIPLFLNGINNGHDTLFHMNRIVGTWEGFLDGQFIVRIYPNTNNGFGYAAPLFYCDYFLYPFALLYGIGVPLVITYKLVLIVFFFITSLIILHTSKYFFNNKRITAYIVSITYLFSSYRILTVYIRSALGEIFSLAFIPLALLAMYKVLYEHKNNWILLGISFTLLLFSHMITLTLYCLLFFIFIIYFIVVNWKDKQLIINTFKTVLKAVILSVGLSAIFLFPFIEQALSQSFKYMMKRGYRAGSIKPFFHLFLGKEVFLENFFGIVNGGTLLIIIAILSLILDHNKMSIFLASIWIVLSLIIAGIIDIGSTSYAHIIQFSFRLYLLTCPIATYLGGRLIDKIIMNKVMIYSLSIMICLYSLANILLINNGIKTYAEHIGNQVNVKELYNCDDKYFIDNYGSNFKEIHDGEYLQSDVVTNFLTDSLSIKERINEWEIIDYIWYTDYKKTGTRFEFYLVTDKEQELMLPQTYYKGYQVYVSDDEWIKLDTYTLPYFYEVTFKTAPGEHYYTSIYKGTIIQKTSIVISALSLITLILIKKKQRIKIVN